MRRAGSVSVAILGIVIILLVSLSTEGLPPARAAWQAAQRWSVGMWKSSLNDWWQLRQGLGSLIVLPLLTSASAILEIQLVEHMLHGRQDGSPQQP